MFYGLLILGTIFSVYSIYKNYITYRKTNIVPWIGCSISIILLIAIGGVLYYQYANYAGIVSFMELLLITVIGTFIVWYFVDVCNGMLVDEWKIDTRKKFLRRLSDNYDNGWSAAKLNCGKVAEYRAFIETYKHNNMPICAWFMRVNDDCTILIEGGNGIIDDYLTDNQLMWYAYCSGYIKGYEIMEQSNQK